MSKMIFTFMLLKKSKKTIFVLVLVILSQISTLARTGYDKNIKDPNLTSIYNSNSTEPETKGNNGTLIAQLAEGKRYPHNETDTGAVNNRSLSVRQSLYGYSYYAFLELKEDDYDNRITIAIFNLLGKKVMDVYEGYPTKNSNIYEIQAASLPNGVYLCVAYGKEFRLDAKFIVSR